jgi:hypothetical protein
MTAHDRIAPGEYDLAASVVRRGADVVHELRKRLVDIERLSGCGGLCIRACVNRARQRDAQRRRARPLEKVPALEIEIRHYNLLVVRLEFDETNG